MINKLKDQGSRNRVGIWEKVVRPGHGEGLGGQDIWSFFLMLGEVTDRSAAAQDG